MKGVYMTFKKIADNVKQLKNDRFRNIVCALSFALLMFHGYQFVISNFSYLCLFRAVFFFLVIPATIFFGRQAVYFMLIIFSIVISYFNPFNNYTGFFCLLMSCIITNRRKNILLALYALNEAFALIMQNCEIHHIGIHILTCAFWYVLYFYITKKKVALNLTDSEIKILDELIAGKQQKEIDFFNKNTITKKLLNARLRNGCKTTNELLFKYRELLDKNKINL